MQETKIQFSNSEMELICNKEIILTKNKAVQKIIQLFEALQEEMFVYAKGHPQFLQNKIFSVNSKISRGENYLGLPYLILDYPRCFEREDIFTIRTMFWWGNFYSTTLHIAGRFKNQFVQKIVSAYEILSNDGFYIGINSDPWQHHFEEGNYKKISALTKEEFLQTCESYPHLKISNNTSLSNLQVEQKLANIWKELVKICFD